MKLDQNLEGQNVLITGQGETERKADEVHDRNRKSLLDRWRERNIKFNKKKFTFKCDEVQFIGHRLTKEGLKPDPAKVKAYCWYEETQWCSCSVKADGYGQVHLKIPWWPLSDLWSYQASNPLRCTMVLDKRRECCLWQDQGLWHRLNSVTHKLAQVFGLEDNHQYLIYGRKVILYTDHKPFVSILRKPFSICNKASTETPPPLYSSMTQKSDTGLKERCISPMP